MELYYMLVVVDRDRERTLQALLQEMKLTVSLTKLGKGTATESQLQLHDLQPTTKAIVGALVTAPSMKQLLRAAKRRMYMDIPGNGIMLFVPVKSVSGKRTLAYFTDGQDMEGGIPAMDFRNELIVVILNEGYADTVMDAARLVGATGGTILHAKGTAAQDKAKFFGVSVVEEKDMLYILASSGKKSQIMKAINSTCGVGTKAGAVCFSLPVSEVIGVRRLDENEQE